MKQLPDKVKKLLHSKLRSDMLVGFELALYYANDRDEYHDLIVKEAANNHLLGSVVVWTEYYDTNKPLINDSTRNLTNIDNQVSDI